jgi:DNA-binding transcriptional LysR family regulator
MTDANSWLGIELRHLAALQAVAEEGSFGAAAVRLGYTQSAVSQQIAALERRVGQRLIDRPGGPRRVAPTEAGRLLLRHARGIVARLEEARADLTALGLGEAGTLRVGTFQSFGAKVLPGLLRRFADAWPGIRVELTEMSDGADLNDAVVRGALELAFTDGAPMPPLEGTLLMRDPYALIVPAGSPLARRDEAPDLAEIAALDLVSYRCCQHTQAFEAGVAARGTPLNVIFRSDDNAIVQGMVSAGMGAALVPVLAVDETDPGVALIDMGAHLPPREILIVRHGERHLSRAGEAFIDVAREQVAAMTRQAA